MRIVALVLCISFGPALLGLTVTMIALLLGFFSVVNVVGPVTMTWIQLCLPYRSGALPYGEFGPQMTLITAILLTFAQFTLVGGLAAKVFGTRGFRAALFIAAGSVAASSLVAQALLSAYDLVSYLETLPRA